MASLFQDRCCQLGERAVATNFGDGQSQPNEEGVAQLHSHRFSDPQTGVPTPPSTLNILANFKGRVYLNISLQQNVQLGNYLIDISTEKHSDFRYNMIFGINPS